MIGGACLSVGRLSHFGCGAAKIIVYGNRVRDDRQSRLKIVPSPIYLFPCSSLALYIAVKNAALDDNTEVLTICGY